MTHPYTPAQLEAFTKPYPAKPLILGGNASMDHYETTVWERTVEAMLKRRAEAAPDLARLVLEKEKEIARLKAAALQANGELERSGKPVMTRVYVVLRNERNYKDSWDSFAEKVFYNKEDAIKFIQDNPYENELYFDWQEVGLE